MVLPPGAGPNHGAIRNGVGNLVGNAVTLSLVRLNAFAQAGSPDH